MTPLKLPKWLKCTINVKISQNPIKWQKCPQNSYNSHEKFVKWPNYNWNLKNKQNAHESSENYKNTPKLSQSTLDFLDFWDILVSFELCCSF